MDTFGNSKANTCIQTLLVKGFVCWIPNLPTSVVFLTIHDKLLVVLGDETFKFLTFQLSMVGYWPTLAVTGNIEFLEREPERLPLQRKGRRRAKLPNPDTSR